MKLFKNYLYNVFYQIVIVFLPFITLPYVTRVLGSDGLGVYAFVDSIAQYVMLFGTLGISLYGTRNIAYVSHDKEKRSKLFWEVSYLKFITVPVALLIYLGCVLFLDTKYTFYLLLHTILIVSVAFDISWFFMGMEDFKKVVLRNFIVRLICVACIFIFINKHSDLWKYFILLTGTNLIGNLALWPYLSKIVNRESFSLKKLKPHLIPVIGLLAPQVAMHIYLFLDRIMIGVFSTASEVGFYDVSIRIVKCLVMVVASLGIVMMPRISNLFAQNEIDKLKTYVTRSFNFASCLAVPFVLCLVAATPYFVPWFLGVNFSKSILLITLVSPIILAIAWRDVTGTQLMIPIGKQNLFTVSVCIGAVINFGLNLLLIPVYQSSGACVATVAAEFSVFVFQFIIVRSFFPVANILNELWRFIIAGLIAFATLKTIGIIMGVSILTTLVQFLAANVVYIALLFVLRSETNKFLYSKGIEIYNNYRNKAA